MSWPVVLLVAYVLFGVELALKHALSLGESIAPSFVVPFVVFVGLHTRPTAALWTAIAAGIVIDLTSPHPTVVVGPHALGLMLGVAACLQLRTLMIRRHPVTLIVLSVLAAAVMNVVALTVLALRDTYPGVWADPFELGLRGQIVSRFYSSLYTAAAALVLVPLLFPLTPVFRFKDQHGHRFER